MRLVKTLVTYLRRPGQRDLEPLPATTPSLASNYDVPTLPPEVWMIIAGFINPTDLEKLNGVNRLFFEIVMDNRYREVRLVDSNPRSLFRKIDALKSDNIACRVQVLKIRACALWNALESGIPPPKQHPQPLSTLIALSETPRRRGLQNSEDTTAPDVPMSMGSRCTDLLLTIKRLSNVRQLHLCWHAPTTRGDCSTGICPLLVRAWLNIGPRLSSLFLHMPLFVLAEFVASLPPMAKLPNLRQLEIVSNTADRDRITPDSADTLLPLIHNHSDTLKSLSIATYEHIDLSSFFRGLGYLPCLTTFSFRSLFDANHFLDPQAFNQFLMNHPNLSSLTIRNRFSDCCRSWQRPSNVITEEWLHGCFDGVSFSQLEELRLGLNYHAGVHQRISVAMRPICFSLSSLVLLDRCLMWDDLNIILQSLQPRHIKALSLFVRFFNIKLVDLLSESCPSLQHLTLRIESVGGWHWHGDRQFTYHRTEEHFIETMRYGRSRELLNTWKLRSIDIWRCDYGQRGRRQWTLMRALADIMPNIDSLPEGEMPDDHWPHPTMSMLS